MSKFQSENGSVAVGIPVYQRTESLQRCLESVDGEIIHRVIIADNGHRDDRQHLYERDWPFECTVLNLDYDVGIGACRSAIVDELTEDFLIAVDNDMLLPPREDIELLRNVLMERPELGGVSGILVENDRVRSGCTNLHEDPLLFGQKAIIHDIRSPPTVEWVWGSTPIAKFDKLTQASMFRKECLNDYSWDSNLPVKEHLDFFIGHHRRTDWEFAACPTVFFNHRKELDKKYRKTIRSGKEHRQKNSEAIAVIKEKWGYDRFEFGQRVEWIDTESKPTSQQLYRLLQRFMPIKYLLPVKDTIDRLSK